MAVAAPERTAPEPTTRVVTPLLVSGSRLSSSAQPVSVGVPFPKGSLSADARLALVDGRGQTIPLQVTPLARWSDGSVKWGLLDCLLAPENGTALELTEQAAAADSPTDRCPAVTVREAADLVVIDTGRAVFHINRRTLQPFTRVTVGGHDVFGPGGSRVSLTDPKGREAAAIVSRVAVEASGPVRATVRLEGAFRGRVRARFVARLSFFAGTGLVKFALTVHNPNRARHTGGLWDLGDRGSMRFRDLSVHLPLAPAGKPSVSWAAEVGQPLRPAAGESLEIYQDSSGGENWRSRNHVNRLGEVPCSFRGYRVRVGGQESRGDRAAPVVSVRGAAGTLGVVVPEFWQQFPKALEAEGDAVRVRLFPGQFGDLFELQGGEQKTHVLWLDCAEPAEASLAWAHRLVRLHAPPEWYAASGAVPYLTPASEDTDTRLRDLLAGALEGENNLFARREIIDEYGWRNYGDLYADHEAAYYQGPAPVISHYNNQYDAVYGTLLQFFRTGDTRWLDIHDPLARHVIDIDIYHTDRDRAAYNGGLFWHTDHYRDAATATHRAYSRANQKVGQPYGGGPCNEHNWTTGLLHYHYHTGDPAAREAVLGLADWVLALDDGSRTVFGLVDDGPTGLASSTTERDYHGPGRGCGNSINALLDGWLLSGRRHYLAKAEALIHRTIHPQDDVAARDLLNVEQRWSYTVYLSVLARYLALKTEAGEVDQAYAYARASLVHYAAWMLEHEVPYFDCPEKLEYPTETWAAQELRKANVLRLAAAHTDEPQRLRLRQRGEELVERAWTDLLRFAQPTTTRALAILFTEGPKDSAFRAGMDGPAPRPSADGNCRARDVFVSQRQRVRARLKSPVGLVGALLRLADPRRWLRLLTVPAAPDSRTRQPPRS